MRARYIDVLGGSIYATSGSVQEQATTAAICATKFYYESDDESEINSPAAGTLANTIGIYLQVFDDSYNPQGSCHITSGTLNINVANNSNEAFAYGIWGSDIVFGSSDDASKTPTVNIDVATGYDSVGIYDPMTKNLYSSQVCFYGGEINITTGVATGNNGYAVYAYNKNSINNCPVVFNGATCVFKTSNSSEGNTDVVYTNCALQILDGDISCSAGTNSEGDTGNSFTCTESSKITFDKTQFNATNFYDFENWQAGDAIVQKDANEPLQLVKKKVIVLTLDGEQTSKATTEG